MNEHEQWCFDNLREECVDTQFLKESHGIDWPPDAQFEEDFRAWLTDNRFSTCLEGRVSRYAFEWFLQSAKFASRKAAAAQLGMDEESLDRLLPDLPKLGLRKRYEVYRGIIDQSLSEDLVRRLPGLRFRTFGDHDSFCELLHSALRKALELEIKPLFCATADVLGEQRMYASTWDNITLQPLSARHGVWLDFQKPPALAPDRCSKLFFAENREELLPFLAGRGEPHDIGVYQAFLEMKR